MELKALRDIPPKHYFVITQQISNPHVGNRIKLTDRIYMENVKEGNIINIDFCTKHLFDTGNMFLMIHSYDISMEDAILHDLDCGPVGIYNLPNLVVATVYRRMIEQG